MTIPHRPSFRTMHLAHGVLGTAAIWLFLAWGIPAAMVKPEFVTVMQWALLVLTPGVALGGGLFYYVIGPKVP